MEKQIEKRIEKKFRSLSKPHTQSWKKSQIETTVSVNSFENPEKSMAKIANSNNNRNVCEKNADANSFIAIK